MDGDDFRRRTLRTWAVLDLFYGAVVILLALLALPWKVASMNLAFVAFGLLCAASAPGLWRGARWAWTLAVSTSLLGLAAAATIVAGLVASWAYLRAIYGAFGAGASIASLLIAGMVAQVLGLYPALRLRALLRREVRAGTRGARVLVGTTVALALLPLPVGLAVHLRHQLRPLPPLAEEALVSAVAVVRAGLEGTAAPAAPSLSAISAAGGLHGSLWLEGEVIARAQGQGEHLAAAARTLGERLRSRVAQSGRAVDAGRARLSLERVVAEAPILQSPTVALALSFDPGLDGLRDGDGKIVFLPHEVLTARSAGASAPLAAMDELRLGIDVGWLAERMTAAGARPPLSRVRTESWIEAADGDGHRDRARVIRLHRGREDPAPTGLSARAAAIQAGDFILRQIQSDGRFGYRYDPVTDKAADAADYNFPRHAGTAYGLVLLHAHTGELRFREGAEAALSWLALQVPPTCGGRAELACLLPQGSHAPLGASMLAAIAMLEYDRRTGDGRYREIVRRLLALALAQQRPDGEFHHLHDSESGAVVPSPPRMFASEQAAVALALGHRVLGDARYLGALERALDFLTEKKYDFFLGHFIYGSDHWTCIAADEAWPALRHRRYFDFCAGYARFMSRLQYPESTAPARDFAGHYGFGYLLVPQAPATAGFAEALLSTVALAEHHGAPSGELRAQTTAALRALARDQIRPDNAFFMRHLPRAIGGIRRSLVEPEIRIDFVQHAASALVRAQALGLGAL